MAFGFVIGLDISTWTWDPSRWPWYPKALALALWPVSLALGPKSLLTSLRAASASRAEVVKCGRIYDCYAPILQPYWAPTADDPSDAYSDADECNAAVIQTRQDQGRNERLILHLYRHHALYS